MFYWTGLLNFKCKALRKEEGCLAQLDIESAYRLDSAPLSLLVKIKIN